MVIMSNKQIYIDKDEITSLILQGKTIKELQEFYNCSRTLITEYKRNNGLVGLSPNSKKLDRTATVKQCLSCKNYLPLSEFYTNGYTSTGKIKYKSRCNTCSSIDRKSSFYKLIFDYLNTTNRAYKCEVCGIDGPFGFLDFHHKDPSTKLFDIGSVSKTTSIDNFIDNIVPELDKCILLCPNCHRLDHLIMGRN